tara:strand:- start:1623 stop:2396 length:774 start_codon:yes stop_codon:yes gene_type:complete
VNNRFNLNEEEKNRIRGLHGIQPIKEQLLNPDDPIIGPQNKPTPPPPPTKRYTVTYQPGDDAKYTEQEWRDGYKKAHLYLQGLLNGKTLNLYEKYGDKEGEVLTHDWSGGPLKINISKHDLQLSHYKNYGGDNTPGIDITVEGVVQDPMHGDILNTTKFKLSFNCDENFLRASGEDDEKLYWVTDKTGHNYTPDRKVSYKGSSSEFMNDDLTNLLKTKLCDDTTPNPFTEFYDMIMGGREVPDADFSMGDEDIESFA